MKVLSKCSKCWFVLLPIFLVAVSILFILPYYREYLKQQAEKNKPQPITYTWQTYHNDEFGFGFEYPKSDTTNISWKLTEYGLVPGSTYRYGISSLIYVDLSKTGVTGVMPDMNENQCVAKADGYDHSLKTNAVIGGEKAFVKYVSIDRRYHACFQYNDLFFDISYIWTDSQSQYEEIFPHVLETFVLDGRKKETNIPDLHML